MKTGGASAPLPHSRLNGAGAMGNSPAFPLFSAAAGCSPPTKLPLPGVSA